MFNINKITLAILFPLFLCHINIFKAQTVTAVSDTLFFNDIRTSKPLMKMYLKIIKDDYYGTVVVFNVDYPSAQYHRYIKGEMTFMFEDGELFKIGQGPFFSGQLSFSTQVDIFDRVSKDTVKGVAFIFDGSDGIGCKDCIGNSFKYFLQKNL